MADGSEYAPERPATRRELDSETRHLQRQIDALERAFEERSREMRDELRRMGETMQQGMALLSQKLERWMQDQRPPPSPALITREDLQQLKKSGTPLWMLALIAVGALFAYLFLHKLGAV